MSTLKTALIGYGKMGRAIHKLAPSYGLLIAAIIDPTAPEATATAISGEALDGIDVCIEFTNPKNVLDNILALAALGKHTVVGTTGWYHQLPTVQQAVDAAGTGLLYAENFSLGVNILYQLVKTAAKQINRQPQYDIAITEGHHNQKVDAPSGTAKVLQELLVENIDRKDNIDISSFRCGATPGEHTIIFDSPCDTITLSHKARNRDGWSLGAIEAAKWISTKPGVHHVSALLDDQKRELTNQHP